jgi:DNA-binding CsgD family transcriptional regulator
MSGADGQRLLLEAEAEILLAEGEPAAALPLLDQANRLVPHVSNPAWRRGPAILAGALASLGRTEEALDLLAREIVVARRFGAPGVLGGLLRRSGAIRVDVDAPAGLAELTEAEALLADSAARLEHAEGLHALGSALLAGSAGDRARAVELLSRALEIAEGGSAQRLLRRVRAALGEAGVVIPAARRVGLAALTSTQRRIAMLLADGVPVRDVAEALFLTPRVVEQRLAEVRSRLGISSGDDLATALAAAADSGREPVPADDKFAL